MSTTPLTLEAARRKIGEIFVYHMPFNRELGLELRRFDDDYVELSFTNQRKLVGNAAQEILHGGVIAAVLDVAAGLACAGGVLTRLEPLVEEEIAAKLSRMGTIDLHVDYLRPGRGEHFVASASVLRSGNKVAVARVELHNHDGLHIATATATYLVG
ncbi:MULTISPECIES: thioesterase family protein [Serratia]|uniref:thioesterase family protein n=1 Tax=Serratia TaxID=613 RepID=UPI0011546D4B|nr:MULTISPECIES: thioesterase family protein [Serratia]MBH3142829.1 thioesterase family protein [Serratia ureilytica]QDI36030.1 thioesterase family protein [Serratia marcescens]UNE44130.1 thioesterase family protein [Serratia ureilytica]HED2503040.1 thioesterase family protein [Serratia marcescens]